MENFLYCPIKIHLDKNTSFETELDEIFVQDGRFAWVMEKTCMVQPH
jgi:hypothetical protein